MKKSLFSTSIAVLLASTGTATLAATVTIPNTFTSGTPAVAAQVNDNFTAVADAVNANDSAITALQAGSGTSCAGQDATDIMVQIGSVCIDKYESSVWDSAAGGGTQYDGVGSPYPCVADGSDCGNAIYARSQAGVTPSANIAWSQAVQACANVGKRLPTAAEWQLAASGTPSGVNADPAAGCNTGSGAASTTGLAGTLCESSGGAADMVGNVLEWAADLVVNYGGTSNTSTDNMKVLSFGDDYLNSIGGTAEYKRCLCDQQPNHTGRVDWLPLRTLTQRELRLVAWCRSPAPRCQSSPSTPQNSRSVHEFPFRTLESDRAGKSIRSAPAASGRTGAQTAIPRRCS